MSRLPLPAVALALLIGSLTANHTWDFTRIPPRQPDRRTADHVLLEHAHQWVSGQTLPRFIDGPFVHPVRGVISYADTFAGQLPFCAGLEAPRVRPRDFL